jgi:hypothetical protein
VYIYIYIYFFFQFYHHIVFTSRLGYFCLSKLGYVKANLTCFNFKPGLGKKLGRNVFFFLSVSS